jgi:DNA-binding NarL/FixJ family response regulator
MLRSPPSLLDSGPSSLEQRRSDAMTTVGSALIVEDHPLYRDALVQLLATTLGSDVPILVGSTAEEGLRLAHEHRPFCIVLVDPGLPGMSGAQVITALREVIADTPVIAVSASEERRHAASALHSGACAFVSKAVNTEILASVVLRALRGEISEPEWITPTYSGVMPVEDEHSPLTQRQAEILQLIAQGYANKEIGQRLNLAEPTVKMHVSAIFRALQVASRTQAVRAARQRSWISFEEADRQSDSDRVS